MPTRTEDDDDLPDGPLTELSNLGDVTLAWLQEVGIPDRRTLEKLGPVETFRRVRDRHPDRVTKNLLFALAGALMEMDWHELPGDMKQHLLFDLEALDKKSGAVPPKLKGAPK